MGCMGGDSRDRAPLAQRSWQPQQSQEVFLLPILSEPFLISAGPSYFLGWQPLVMRDGTPGDGEGLQTLPAPSQQGTATPERQIPGMLISPSCWGRAAQLPWWGNPGEHVARAAPASCAPQLASGEQALLGCSPSCVSIAPVQPPPGSGWCPGQGSAAPLSGGRVQPDNESLLDSGSKQSISGKRWAGEIKAEIRNPPLGSRPIGASPKRGAALPQPSPPHLQAEPKQAQPSKARFKPSSLLCRPQGCPDYLSTRDGKAGIISLAPLERFPFVSRGEEWRCCVFTA